MGYYQKYRDNINEWRWTYRASNHKIIGVSSEGYVAERDCDRSIQLMKQSYNDPVYLQ